MRAMRVHHFGPPAVIRQDEIEAPEPDEHQVLVRVAAAGVGPWDGWIRAGKSVLPQPLPLTLGSDLSGTVVALGRGVQDVRVGDEIFGVTNPSFTGAYAEYALAQVGMISTKPRSLPHEQAAGIPVVAVTAKQMLFAHADVRAGQRVLVLGAAGSVGALAVQLANLAGAEVIGTVTNEADLAFVAGLGARQVVDGKRTRFEQEVAPVDVVIDLVGGASQLQALARLKPGGVLVSAVAAPPADELTRLGVRGEFMLVEVRTRDLTDLAELFEARKLSLRMGPLLQLGQAQEAHEILEGIRPRAQGKMVLRVQS